MEIEQELRKEYNPPCGKRWIIWNE
jgi:hypothetical protein